MSQEKELDEKDVLVGTDQTEDREMNLELSYERRFNLGDFNHKIFNVKLSGPQRIIEDQLRNHKNRLVKYLREVENMVQEAHVANLKKAEIEAVQTDVKS